MIGASLFGVLTYSIPQRKKNHAGLCVYKSEFLWHSSLL